MRTFYFDESKASSFLLVGTCVDNLDKTKLRKKLSAFLLPGQRSLHFKHEKARRRRHLLVLFREIGFRVIVFRVSKARGSVSRRTTILAAVDYARLNRINQMVFELDESAKMQDDQILSRAIRLTQGKREMQWDHRQRHEEPLLWVADAVAWCVNRGGEWERMVRPMIVETIEC